MNEELETTQSYDNKTFEDIKHIDKESDEYWLARELMPILEYKEWRFFEKVINNAIVNCNNSGVKQNDHFGVYSKTIKMPKNATKVIIDFKLIFCDSNKKARNRGEGISRINRR